MKKLIITLAFLSAANIIFAQENSDDDAKKDKKIKTHHHFNIDLGMNNYLENGSSPSSDNELYTVKPWGSWYIALKSIHNTEVAGKLHLLWGADVSWYNFKFENADTRLTEGDNGVIFTEASDMNSSKSKLTAAYVNASLVPMMQFGKKDDSNDSHWSVCNPEQGFRIGAGMYAGYRIDSYTKTVASNRDDEKMRDHEGYYLNDFRYGVRFQFGYKNVDFFANYDLNNLFATNKGPELNAFSFGVVL